MQAWAIFDLEISIKLKEQNHPFPPPCLGQTRLERESVQNSPKSREQEEETKSFGAWSIFGARR